MDYSVLIVDKGHLAEPKIKACEEWLHVFSIYKNYYVMDKRILVLLFFSVLFFAHIFAQGTDGCYKKKYRNLSFTTTTMRQDDVPDLKSNYGAAFTVGRTFYLHKNPIAGMLRFGIDATWFDLNYANYKIEHITYWETNEHNYHQGEVSMQVGPSVVLNPVSKLNIHAYFRYAPAFSVIYAGDGDGFYGNYATLFVGGGSVSYGMIGLGIESRFGSCNYKEFGADEEEGFSALKTKFGGWRAYITFRF